MRLARACAGVLAGLGGLIPVLGIAATVDISSCAKPLTETSFFLDTRNVLVVRLPSGASAAIAWSSSEVKEASYRWRYRAKAGAVIATGTGRVFEQYETVTTIAPASRIVKLTSDPAGLYLVAGEIKLKWSAGSKSGGWIYHCSGLAEVEVLPVEDFERQP